MKPSKLAFRSTTLPPSISDANLNLIIRSNRTYSFLGFLGGFLLIVCGAVFLAFSFAGNVSLVAEIFGNKFQLSNAPFGIVFSIFGIFVILITKTDYK